MYAFGITIWEACSLGRTPYPDLSTREAALAVLKGARMASEKFVSAALTQLMEACWATEADSRPTFEVARGRLAHLRKQATTHLQLPKVRHE